MTDTQLLKQAIESSGVTITFIADSLGCTRNRIYAIMDGTGGEVTTSEVVGISKCLHLTRSQRDKIFLTEKVN